jgi:hypothetical protein
MKFNKLIAMTTVVCLSGLANANIIDKGLELPLVEKKKITKVKYTPSKLGAYKLEPLMAVIPSAIASADSVVETKGAMSIVNIDIDSTSDVVGKGSIVRHSLTNKLTSLTGNITVLLNDGVKASDLAKTVGMEVVSVFPKTNIAILKATKGNDLLEALAGLKLSGLVAESKVEVTNSIYSTQ